MAALGNFLRSRGVRKFRRSRLAMTSLAVIGLYLVVAAFVAGNELFAWAVGDEFDPEEHKVLGAFVIERTAERVGPNGLAGFGVKQDPEKRYQHHEFFLDQLERALEADDPEKAVRELHFAELRLADRSLEELAAGLDRAWELFDEMDEIYDEIDVLYEELDEVLDAVDDSGEPAPDVALEAELEAEIEAAKVRFGQKVDEIGEQVAELYPKPGGFDGLLYSLRTLAGTDRQGRSVLLRAVYSIKTAVQVGVVTALVSVLIGSVLGAAAAMFGGVVDLLVIWLYSTFSSIPYLVLLTVLVFMFVGSAFDGTMVPLYTAFCLTFWVGPCRVIRGEALKIKELEYVQAATSIGFSRPYILLRHVLPNTAHLVFIYAALNFIAAIKGEVILTFLGLGLKDGASWGLMINSSIPEVITNSFWQIGAATFFMFFLVMAFNVFTDSLQDAFDPKHVD